MINSILIANRGEIACRVIRTAKQMGVRTIAIYSAVDANALHVKMADEAHLIGAAPVNESYLKADEIIALALKVGAQAIHPGYGFLSENAEFSQKCADAGVKFIGPSAHAIKSMGLKDAAKLLMQQADVPIVPGYIGDNQQPEYLAEQAIKIGYPVMIKAVAGGGGKGMRRVDEKSQFLDALGAAKREAMAAFGNDIVLIEKFILNPRHIEIQIFGDQFGNFVYLFERDCSLQRRHQKVVEEAPAPGMTPDMRQAMGEAAIRAAKAVDYEGAGTVEFIVDGSAGLKPDGFWFMEMNTRLQVEHPVTEAITGQDLVEWQIRVASGETLPKNQAELSINGHAVEVRVYAEDAEHDFLPSIGEIIAFDVPQTDGIRLDTGVKAGDEISRHYDPMMAKIICHAPNRKAALSKLSKTLRATVIAGVKVNIGFLRDLLEDTEFIAETFDTGFIERFFDKPRDEPDLTAVSAMAAVMLTEKIINAKNINSKTHQAWDRADAFDMAQGNNGRKSIMDVMINNQPHQGEYIIDAAGVRPGVTSETALNIIHGNAHDYIVDQGKGYQIDARIYDDGGQSEAGGQVTSPMPGCLFKLNVALGDEVVAGDVLAIVEAMKMEHNLVAEISGTVTNLAVSLGEQVSEGQLILRIE
ncbi:MAG: acetyl/propionyl/methylcrotonyl-CoA carboxylase subunit alpha [Rhizobiales bacterium]|nr:acetyl/propionyl/methylcrotonyl-CoA carboxylase subunit alpha [Hyphomicrobiales bacterium]NRB13208.1 acetyl/propionyl/methylcrotonyl-CoA carboxylase subunit alpha [Hyphomicrobiales bacterium]